MYATQELYILQYYHTGPDLTDSMPSLPSDAFPENFRIYMFSNSLKLLSTGVNVIGVDTVEIQK